ncbi:MAG: hypothetical protein AMXMBFR84_04430 [Candidatus Hydrogenedentota bacterium]
MNMRDKTRKRWRRMGLSLVIAAMALLPAAIAEEGVIQPGDLVYVDVYRRPEVSTTTQVDGNGNISLPYVGTVNIGGLGTAEASSRVANALSSIVREPRVTVSKTMPTFSTAYRTEEMKTELVPLHNARAESLTEALRHMTSEGGAIGYDPDTNTLIVTDSPGTVQNIMAVINRLDKMESQLAQVRIEAKIAEVKIGAMKELGVRWFAQGTEVNGGYYPMGTQTVPLQSLRGESGNPINNEIIGGNPTNSNNLFNSTGRRFVNEDFDRLLNVPAMVPKVGQLFLGVMNGNVDLGVFLDALVADNQAELLANPTGLTVNHKPAEIRMTDEFPYQEFGIEATGRESFSTRFMDLGIIMNVTPHVGQSEKGRYVTLEMDTEVSFPVGASDGIPIRSVRSYTGEADVMDGQSLVVGGIYRNEVQDTEQRVPGVGKLPILGNLFKHTEKTRQQTELMIFVTPKVFDSPDTVTWDRMLDLSKVSDSMAKDLSGVSARTQEVRRD